MSRCVQPVIALAVLLTAVASAGWAESPGPTPQEPKTVSLAVARPTDRQVKAYLYIQRKYTDLHKDIEELVSTKHPDLWKFMEAKLAEVVKQKYPDLDAFVQEEIIILIQRVSPTFNPEVVRLVTTRYPALRGEIWQIIEATPDGDPRPEIAKHIRENYPNLLDDILGLIKRRQPSLLPQIQRRIAEKYPALGADIMAEVKKKYPALIGDVISLAQGKHPELIPIVAGILAGREPLPVTGEPEEGKEAVEGGEGAKR